MTVIDDTVEPLVREALAAVVSQDPERLKHAIQAFTDEQSLVIGVQLAVALALFVIHERLAGRRPTEAEIAKIARNIVEDEEWTDVTVDEIIVYLTAAYRRVRAYEVLPMERVIILTFVIAANLISSYRGDDEQWWDYLDRAEAMIEASPEP